MNEQNCAPRGLVCQQQHVKRCLDARTPLKDNERRIGLKSTHLEHEEGGGGSLLEELQEVWHHHLGAVGAVALLCRLEVGLLLVAAPGLEVAHGVADGEGHRQEELLLLAVEDVADLLELEGQDALAGVALVGREGKREIAIDERMMRVKIGLRSDMEFNRDCVCESS